MGFQVDSSAFQVAQNSVRLKIVSLAETFDADNVPLYEENP